MMIAKIENINLHNAKRKWRNAFILKRRMAETRSKNSYMQAGFG